MLLSYWKLFQPDEFCRFLYAKASKAEKVIIVAESAEVLPKALMVVNHLCKKVNIASLLPCEPSLDFVYELMCPTRLCRFALSLLPRVHTFFRDKLLAGFLHDIDLLVDWAFYLVVAYLIPLCEIYNIPLAVLFILTYRRFWHCFIFSSCTPIFAPSTLWLLVSLCPKLNVSFGNPACGIGVR